MGYRLLFILFLWCNASNAQMLCNGWRFSAAPSHPTAWAYFQAEDAATITQSGNVISAWNDKSGNGRNWAQGTAGNRPDWTASSTVVTFSGSGTDNMTISLGLTQQYTIYMVASVNIPTNGDAAQVFSDNTSSNLYLDIFRSSGNNNVRAFTNSGSITSSATIANNTYALFRWVINGGSSNSSVRVNNTNTTGSLGTNAASSPIRVGYLGSNSTTLNIKYISIFQGSAADDAAVKAFTNYYYGLSN